MSDLLSRLIGRATGAPSRVEPLLPSIYEPAGVSEGPRLEERAETVPLDAAAPAPHERVARRTNAEARGVPALDPRPALEDRAAADLPPAARPSMPPREAPRVLPRQPRVASPASVRANTPRAAHAKDVDAVAGQPADSRQVERPVMEESAAAGRAEPQSAFDVPSATEATTVRVARDESRQPAERRDAPLFVTRPERTPPVEVQVTIGHIEVRTAPVNVPAPQRRPARPGVSLDDYLRRRDGGSR